MTTRRGSWAVGGFVRSRSAGRQVASRVALVVAAAAALLAGVGVAGPVQSPASAASATKVEGLSWMFEESAENSEAVKRARAECPQGKRVLGGGARINGPGRMVLTRLRPYYEKTYGKSGYVVTAAETYAGNSKNWKVDVYAICADPLPGYHIVTTQTARSSSARQAAVAPCPGGKRAVGSGATVGLDHGLEVGVGLQVARASGSGDSTRAQAHEAPQGYPYDWNLFTHAVCADTPAGYQVVYDASEQRGTESYKVAYAKCPEYWDYSIPGLPRKFRKPTISMGGAVSDVAPADATLRTIEPWYFDRIMTGAVGPTDRSWDSIVSQAICVFR
ncbi:hypothetical protein ABN028_23075 [Actinopolymorpha sp. B17G11]|uniref:hypothetical protein n=1 Tax=Actinopolymorpha sp. B17G11 TaxID=3160861 RepID=UPI0032E4D579